MYSPNTIYIWQHQTGEMAHLNGTECTVIGEPREIWCLIKDCWAVGQLTDSPSPNPRNRYFAEAGDLRPKRPSPGTGLTAILDLFKETA